YLIRVMLTIH
ncbi:hypothetical protein ECEC1846_3119, partial [Escherichia coli EC1846]